MDNFGGEYAGKHHVQHLIDYLQKKYIIIVGWSGKIIGLKIESNY